MKKAIINLYLFSELSAEAQQKAIENLSDLNVSHDWWQSVYDDAENIGLKLEEFEFDSASFVRNLNGEFNLSASEIAQNILNEHGATCETYKTATNFLKKFQPIFSEYMDETSEKYESAETEKELQNLETEFLHNLLIDYKQILQEEYEYQTSDESIKETIEANQYYFFQNGTLAPCTTYTGKHERAGETVLNFHGQEIKL